jgi:D-alanyl-D-alanine carboxypeptidase
MRNACVITKTFVATVVLQLAAEGRLSLNDSVQKWLPGAITGHGYDPSRITIRELLQQTSGLRDYTSGCQPAGMLASQRPRRKCRLPSGLMVTRAP